MNHLNDNELVLALDGEMEEADLKRAVDHLAECEACRNRWEKLQGLSARVAEYSNALYADAAGREHRPRLVEPAAKVSSFGFRVPSWGLAAAVLLIGASVAFWNTSHSPGAHPIAQTTPHKDGAQDVARATGLQSDRDPSRKERAQDDKPNLSGASTLDSTAHANLGGAHPVAQEKNLRDKDGARLSKRGPKVNRAKQGGQQNAANQYTELPFSNAALPLDQATATVVRVTLPAAALRQAGVAVNEDSANAMLQADVVLGMDGLPRGIRLVNSSGTTN